MASRAAASTAAADDVGSTAVAVLGAVVAGPAGRTPADPACADAVRCAQRWASWAVTRPTTGTGTGAERGNVDECVQGGGAPREPRRTTVGPGLDRQAQVSDWAAAVAALPAGSAVARAIQAEPVRRAVARAGRRDAAVEAGKPWHTQACTAPADAATSTVMQATRRQRVDARRAIAPTVSRRAVALAIDAEAAAGAARCTCGADGAVVARIARHADADGALADAMPRAVLGAGGHADLQGAFHAAEASVADAYAPVADTVL